MILDFRITIIKRFIICGVILFALHGQIFASDEITTQSDMPEKQQNNVPEENDFDESWDDDFDDEDDVVLIWDPLDKINRGSFYLNDKLYFWCVKPVAKTYKRFTPSLVRTSLYNFFNNLGMPQRTINCILQLRIKNTGEELGSFLINTTLGILGFANPAKTKFHLKVHSEDLGQTFGYYGIGNGIYIVIPILGSSSVRDMAGMFGDSFVNPFNYIRDPYISIGVSGLKTVNNTSFRLGQYESLKEAAFEPYSAMKDAYVQYRNKEINQ
jgi:phospholipid-binding lipoprotein MlaA